MENTALNVDLRESEEEEIPDKFICCVCLDLLYKPVVLSCGHISCFWCVHKSMKGVQESLCPICRQSYYHFPSICWMLHFLLLKLYPLSYTTREKQTLEEENSSGYFSPQLGSNSCELLPKDFVLGHSPRSSTKVDLSTSEGNHCETLEHPSIPSSDTTIRTQMSSAAISCVEKDLPQNNLLEENDLPQNKFKEDIKHIAVTDVLCSACKQLLIEPVVLNCGHVYCETCIIKPTVEQIRCEVCHCLNPVRSPKVCLFLDNFLKEQFSEEYVSRIDAIKHLRVQLKQRSETKGPEEVSRKQGLVASFMDNLPSGVDPQSKIHPGAGCDYCGMYPIIGDRYRCQDCKDKMGFDLCGDCYNTSSKLPGRFNQHHTPEHNMKFCEGVTVSLLVRILSSSFLGGSPDLILVDEIFEGSQDVQENTESDTSVSTAANPDNQSE